MERGVWASDVDLTQRAIGAQQPTVEYGDYVGRGSNASEIDYMRTRVR